MIQSTKTVREHFAEVIASTNEVVIAQCYKEDLANNSLKKSVSQGSLVKIKSSYDNSFISYGIISKINNSSLDNIHRPSALGLNSKELEYLQPQIFDLLRKELEIYLFAHKDNSEILNYPPQKPMMIHDFVEEITNEEGILLTSDISSLIGLIKRNQLKPDILIAPIHLGYKLRNFDYNYLIKRGQEMSRTFSDDMDSIMQILKRFSSTINSSKDEKNSKLSK